ncbi:MULTISPECIES: GtrA family protein [unclassified Streptomyces]|uniref:GtrA family protein n=1 Tax=unclassified Streptomyces TaxID=2593676 RepID=UPI00367C232F
MTVRIQMVRFALVGVANTGTYYAFYLLLLSRMPYVAAHVVASVLSMIGSFFLNSWFTYRTRPTWRKFLLFPLTNAANFVITTVGVYLLVDVMHFGSRYAPLIAAAGAIPITFVVSRAIMLRPDPRPRKGDRSPRTGAQSPASARTGAQSPPGPREGADHVAVADAPAVTSPAAGPAGSGR